MWAIERTENNLQHAHEAIEELDSGTNDHFYHSVIRDNIYRREVLKCLVQIARNLADISDSLSEMNGYDLSKNIMGE